MRHTRTIQYAILLSIACLLAVESNQLRGHGRHDTSSNGFSAQLTEEASKSDCGTTSVAICETPFAEVVTTFGKPCSLAILLDSFCAGPPLFLRGPPLS